MPAQYAGSNPDHHAHEHARPPRLNDADPFLVNSGATTPPPTVTDEQLQVLWRIGRAGGNVHRHAVPPRMLGTLLGERLLTPFGPERVELTNHAVELLVDAHQSSHAR